ncbi:MAG: class I SAM-dependent methyltransferase [Planctomycetota bacterium]|nr:class I SAM-dependent methyltransferase [Planctomycetota bacterium]
MASVSTAEQARRATADSPQSRSREPKQRAVPGVHDAARRLLDKLPRGNLVDVAAGNGAMSHWASANGFQVTAVDVAPDLFELEDVQFIEADLNERLPLPEESADVAVGCEIIEHLENPFHFMRELARVTCPGGHVVISTPNEHNVQCRWSYFTTGFYGHSPYVIREDDPKLPLRHIHMVPLSQLELAWRRAGLELVRYEVSRFRKWSFLLLPFLYPLQTLRLMIRMKWFVRDKEAKQLNHRIFSLMNDPRIFLGRTIVYLLRKPQREIKLHKS